MSCQDDITAVDLSSGVAVDVLERVSAGSGRDENLWSFIDINNITGTNLEDPEKAQKIVKTWDERHNMEIFCDSGVDDQMIIHIPFIHSLRLRSLLLLPPPVTNSYRPTRIRLYTNLAQPPSFSDIEDGLTPIQDLNLSQSPSLWQAGVDSEGRAEGGRREVEEWPLKVQKMASVWSVTLMISDSEGGDKSRLFYIGFKGESRNPRAAETNTPAVPAAQGADAPVEQLAEKKGAGHSAVR
ncbi:galactose-binding domain-like protein [Filobasidium floriforme]|uniref:galactose-binding domain-like protein n=1 Tax=Filobasidium floriforme TaxID=5210 RepID=UPI001E8D7543|nr:galactose-binding domain-like protein [Filobasidium floriforme]KAH8082763.1 galactose-binding domain-like protein [Filobasidium floriforme]